VSSGEALILGLVQGITEFLPISSSGHLVIFQHLLGIRTPGLLFEVLVHFGTLVAVVAFFWADVTRLLRRPFDKLAFLVLVGTIPTGLMGLYLEPLFTVAFDSVVVVGAALIVTGFFLWHAGRVTPGRKQIPTTSIWDALVIGLGQGLAITPGLSRSGTTIAFALWRGLERRTAARYSFLLSIPAIAGATVLELRHLFSVPQTLSGWDWTYLLAAAVAGASGYLAIKFLLVALERGRFYYFSFYCWIAGIIALILAVRAA
jgi:undecaprenyl-diphosphatase